MPKTWYGWQTLLSDAGVLGAIYLAGASDDATPAYFALGAYALGPPLIHLANQRPGSAGISFAMRLGLPLVMGQLASSAASCNSSSEHGESGICAGVWFLLGGVVGAVAASALDAAVLGWKPEPSRARPAATLTPSLWVDRRGARAAVTVLF